MYVFSISFIISRNYKRESFIDTLNSDTEINKWHTKPKEEF